MAQPLWYAGVCDRMLARVAAWKRLWPHGTPHSTRSFLNEGRAVDVTTKRVVFMPWQPEEFAHMVRILKEVRPTWLLTEDMEEAAKTLLHRRLLPDGTRVVPIVSYYKDVEEIYETLVRARDGKSEVDRLLEERIDTGKDLWSLD